MRDEIRALGRRAEIVHLDVSDQASVRTVIDRILQVFPTLDILVNNAGIQKRHEYVVLSDCCMNEIIHGKMMMIIALLISRKTNSIK